MLAIDPAQPARAEDMSAIDRLNAVAITGQQLEAGLQVLAALPAELRQRPHGQALALQAYAREAGFEGCASAALHARLTALAEWTAAHDPDRQSDAEAVLEAAVRYPLGNAAGLAFEPAGFQELILFIEDLPF